MTGTIEGSAADFAADHARWHTRIEERRTAPHGPLSVVSLDWLTAEPARYDGVPGRWSADDDGTVHVELDDGESLELDGEQAGGSLTLGPLTGIESRVLGDDERRIEVAARGGGIALRVRDPRSPDRLGYPGTTTFPPDPAWAIPARFVAEPRAAVRVDSVVPEHPHEYDSPGAAEFELDGATVRLTLFGGATPGSLRAVFADATGADLTFPAARGVEVVRLDGDALLIDFNRATNPPCAYSAGATCPLPPPGNRLPLRIEAGELRPAATPRPVDAEGSR